MWIGKDGQLCVKEEVAIRYLNFVYKFFLVLKFLLQIVVFYDKLTNIRLYIMICPHKILKREYTYSIYAFAEKFPLRE